LMNIGNIDLTESLYMDIIYRKTAILFEASAKIGSILSNNNNFDNLAAFGLHFGKAYQLRNDYLDYFGDTDSTGKNAIEDLYEGKATLPIIHSLSKADKNDEDLLRKSYDDTKNANGDDIIKILRKYKSDLYIEKKIAEETNLAISSINSMSPSDYKDQLISLALFCKDRVS